MTEESAATPFFADAPTGGQPEVSGSSLTVALAVSTFVAECGSFTFGCALSFSSPAESGITADLQLSTSQYAIFGSIMTIGSLISSLVSGKIADFLGRKRTMWLSQSLCTLGWLAIIFAENVWWLYIGRLAMGFGVGIISFVVPVYVAEITPKNLRGALTAGYQMTIAFGISLTYIIGSLVSWRILAIIGSVSGFAQIVGLFCIPESPRWLVKVGRGEEILEVLQKLRSNYVDVSAEAEEIQEYTKSCEGFEKFSIRGILDLFQRKYSQALIVGVGLMVVQQFGGSNAIVSYASYILDTAGFSTTVGSFGMAIIQIPAVIIGVLLMDTWGRRPLTMLSLAGMCLSCFLLGSSFFLKDLGLCKAITPALVFLGLLLYSAFYSFAMGAIPFVIMAEVRSVVSHELLGLCRCLNLIWCTYGGDENLCVIGCTTNEGR
uniref:Major facilitator superfamily (MFS) profile domain-containing protein n=1 Tax=Kalanchoe fedtschenkoi TaxID=63787 RepID=A0A7N0V139_KALFE